jgi:hypothetical protein
MICNLSPGTEYRLHVQLVGNNNQSEKASPTVVETTPTGIIAVEIITPTGISYS